MRRFETFCTVSYHKKYVYDERFMCARAYVSCYSMKYCLCGPPFSLRACSNKVRTSSHTRVINTYLIIIVCTPHQPTKNARVPAITMCYINYTIVLENCTFYLYNNCIFVFMFLVLQTTAEKIYTTLYNI